MAQSAFSDPVHLEHDPTVSAAKQLRGKVVFSQRGIVPFTEKALRAQVIFGLLDRDGWIFLASILFFNSWCYFDLPLFELVKISSMLAPWPWLWLMMVAARRTIKCVYLALQRACRRDLAVMM